MRNSVVSVFLIAALFATNALGAFRIEGKVAFEDGQAIPEATVIIRELYGNTGGMPKVQIMAVATTDEGGEFHFKTDRIRGALHLRLLPDRCDWSGDVSVISKKELSGGRVFIAMTPKKVRC